MIESVSYTFSTTVKIIGKKRFFIAVLANWRIFASHESAILCRSRSLLLLGIPFRSFQRLNLIIRSKIQIPHFRQQEIVFLVYTLPEDYVKAFQISVLFPLWAKIGVLLILRGKSGVKREVPKGTRVLYSLLSR